MAGILGTGTSGLLAFQRALATISNNVANVSTPGYSRQRVELSNRTPQAFGSGFIGSGVQIDSVRRLVDDFNTVRQLGSTSELGRLEQLALLASRVDAAFTDADTTLAAPWSQMFDAAQAVATDPSSTAARQAFLASADTVAARMRYLDTQLQSLDNEVNQRLQAGAEEVNRLATEVARLNLEIGRLQSQAGGQPANDLLDQRDVAVNALSKLIGVTTAVQDDGSMNVYTEGGQALVVGSRSLQFGTAIDPFRPERRSLVVMSGNSTVPLPDGSVGGELGGLLEFRTTVLDATSRRLGELATSLAFTANQVNASGVDLYGNQGAPIFVQPALRPLPGSSNGGAATFTASVTDIAAYRGDDVRLTFNGATWTAENILTGAAVPLTGAGTVANPFVFNGVSVVVGGGAPANGDTVLIQPAVGTAARLQLAMTDPRGIAAAAPVRTSASVTNLGNARPALTVVNRNDPALNNPIDITFITPNSYSINGGPAIAYNPGDVIAANGWELRLDQPAVGGDTFQVRATGPNSSDNANALVLAALDDAMVLASGGGSMNTALREMTVAIGGAARGAETSLLAQQAIDGQLKAQREAVSGVNLDEEAANLLKFQQAYQAAAQVISTADTIFQTLIQAVSR